MDNFEHYKESQGHGEVAGKKAPEQFRIRKERMYVRGAIPSPDADGEYFFLLSPVEKGDNRQQIKARIDMKNPAHRDVIQALSENEKDITYATLKYSMSDSEAMPMIAAISSGLSREQRAIKKGDKVASSWTRDLDDAVDVHYQYKAYNHSIKKLKEFAGSDETAKKIQTKAEDYFKLRAKAELGIGELPTDFDGDWDKFSVNEIVKGEQNGEYTRYDVDVPFSKQFDVNDASIAKNQKLNALRNYSLQKMLVREIAETASFKKDGTNTSILKEAELELLKKKKLFAGHPTRSTQDYSDLSRERLENMGSKALQGLMGHLGAVPSSVEHDGIKSSQTVNPDGSTFNLLNIIDKQAKGRDLIDDSPGSKIAAYLNSADEITEMGSEDTEIGITEEVDKAMEPGFTRLTPEDKLDKKTDKTVMITEAIKEGLDRNYGTSAISM